MDVYDTYYAVTRRLLSFLGVWPYQDPTEQLIRIVLVVLVIFSMVVVEVYTLVTTYHTLDSTVQMLTIIIPSMTFISAYYIPLAHYDGVQFTFNSITYDWAHIKTPEELAIMKTYANQTRLYILIFTVIMYGSCIFLLAPPIVKIFLIIVGIMDDTEELTLPVPLEYFVDKKKYFHLLLLHQIVAVLVLFTCAIAVYSMFFIAIQHACGLFSAISTPKNTEQWIFSCIQRYLKVTQFIDTINASVEMCYLWQISLSMGLVSLSIVHLFQMGTQYNGLSELLYDSSIIPGPIFATYIACFVGQKVVNHSTDVFLTACQLPYYDSSLKMQKLLLFLLMRISKPCTLSVGKMFIFSHEFFSAIIQTSFSYAMMLYTLQ